jgi:hypothetical protein
MLDTARSMTLCHGARRFDVVIKKWGFMEWVAVSSSKGTRIGAIYNGKQLQIFVFAAETLSRYPRRFRLPYSHTISPDARAQLQFNERCYEERKVAMTKRI